MKPDAMVSSEQTAFSLSFQSRQSSESGEFKLLKQVKVSKIFISISVTISSGNFVKAKSLLQSKFFPTKHVMEKLWAILVTYHWPSLQQSIDHLPYCYEVQKVQKKAPCDFLCPGIWQGLGWIQGNALGIWWRSEGRMNGRARVYTGNGINIALLLKKVINSCSDTCYIILTIWVLRNYIMNDWILYIVHGCRWWM